ncbi:MAG: hypothetical protein KC593_16150 [Myxococcales bacterium]|nr:hypothetical protein [Myxococcales bacterium]MCB9625828.1 hypothetical protein [Sandaracinaceae bacterium]
MNALTLDQDESHSPEHPRGASWAFRDTVKVEGSDVPVQEMMSLRKVTTETTYEVTATRVER